VASIQSSVFHVPLVACTGDDTSGEAATETTAEATAVATQTAERSGPIFINLLPWGEVTLIEAVTAELLRVEFCELVVVLGREAERVAKSLGAKPALIDLLGQKADDYIAVWEANAEVLAEALGVEE